MHNLEALDNFPPSPQQTFLVTSDVGLETRSRSRDRLETCFGWSRSWSRASKSRSRTSRSRVSAVNLLKTSRDHGKFRIFYLFYHLFLSLHSPGLTWSWWIAMICKVSFVDCSHCSTLPASAWGGGGLEMPCVGGAGPAPPPRLVMRPCPFFLSFYIFGIFWM